MLPDTHRWSAGPKPILIRQTFACRLLYEHLVINLIDDDDDDYNDDRMGIVLPSEFEIWNSYPKYALEFVSGVGFWSGYLNPVM